MVEHRPLGSIVSHLVLIAGVAIVALPLYVGFVASTLSFDQVTAVPMQMTPGTHLLQNYGDVLLHGSTAGSKAPVGQMMWNSLIMALAIAIGKITISMLSAFAIVYFRFPLRKTFFWMIFLTLMLPVEVRILPTYQVVASLGMVDTYAGLTLPLIASATATFLFRQFFLTVPEELAEAARIDGAGPMRCRAPASPPCSSSCSSTAGTSTCGRFWSPRGKTCTPWSSASSAWWRAATR